MSNKQQLMIKHIPQDLITFIYDL